MRCARWVVFVYVIAGYPGGRVALSDVVRGMGVTQVIAVCREADIRHISNIRTGIMELHTP